MPLREPFVIFGLPRSRTFWTSRWLGAAHDIGREAANCQDFVDRLWRAGGTVETGAGGFGPLLRRAFPSASFVTLRRPWEDVAFSLQRLGIVGLDRELYRRSQALDALEALGAFRIEAKDLSNVHKAAQLWELLGLGPFDFPRWRGLVEQNLQTSLAPGGNDKLVLEAESLDPSRATFWRIGLESWESFWPEAEPLAREHWAEAKEPFPFAPDETLLKAMLASGMSALVTARVNGTLAGYLWYSISPNPQSKGVRLGELGAFYVAPAAAGLGLGRKLMDFALAALAAAGASHCRAHAPPEGRGKGLGRALARLGAFPHQQQFLIPLALEARNA